jgi:hypothetical protein
MNATARILSALILLGVGYVPRVAAQPTAISYEGYFTDANSPAQGLYDFRFTLFDLPDNGATVAGPVFTEDLAVHQGRFRIPLDFGDGAFNGDARWLEIAIRPGADDGDFTVLAPRQQLTPTPYALHAYQAGSVEDGAIGGTAIAPGTLDATHLMVPGEPQPGQVLGFDGGGLLWTTPATGGASVFSLNGTSAYYVAGAVGLGTADPTAGYRLDVAGAARFAPGGLGGVIQFGTPSFETGITIAGDARADVRFDGATLKLVAGPAGGPPGPDRGVAITTEGNVGIGTAIPGAGYRLDVNGSGRFTPGGLGGAIHFGTPSFETGITIIGDARADVRFDGATLKLLAGPAGGPPGPERGVAVHTSGNVGVGTTSPQAKLHVSGDLRYDGQLHELDVADNFAAYVRAADFFLGHSSRRGAPGRALVDLGSSLAVNFGNDWGTTIIGGTVTEVRTLRITGGADLAEPFTLSEQDIAPGSIVIIDEKHPGQLKLSTEAYDTRVAGIVSGANGVNPGIALHQEGLIEGNQNVALSGRVYAFADATSYPIRPGDLLTTSEIPGHAMKVSDHGRAHGAILGKAMSPLSEGRGLVLVLVSLH